MLKSIVSAPIAMASGNLSRADSRLSAGNLSRADSKLSAVDSILIEVQNLSGETVFGPESMGQTTTVKGLKERLAYASEANVTGTKAMRLLIEDHELEHDEEEIGCWANKSSEEPVVITLIANIHPRSRLAVLKPHEVQDLIAKFRAGLKLEEMPSVTPWMESKSPFCGTWQSDKGTCNIFMDTDARQIVYEEPLEDDSVCLRGVLMEQRVHEETEDVEMEAKLFFHYPDACEAEDNLPTAGPQEAELDHVGWIRVLQERKVLDKLSVRIWVVNEDVAWQDATMFTRVKS